MGSMDPPIPPGHSEFYSFGPKLTDTETKTTEADVFLCVLNEKRCGLCWTVDPLCRVSCSSSAGCADDCCRLYIKSRLHLRDPWERHSQNSERKVASFWMFFFKKETHTAVRRSWRWKTLREVRVPEEQQAGTCGGGGVDPTTELWSAGSRVGFQERKSPPKPDTRVEAGPRFQRRGSRTVFECETLYHLRYKYRCLVDLKGVHTPVKMPGWKIRPRWIISKLFPPLMWLIICII